MRQWHAVSGKGFPKYNEKSQFRNWVSADPVVQDAPHLPTRKDYGDVPGAKLTKLRYLCQIQWELSAKLASSRIG